MPSARSALIQPRGKSILDTCGGLGYFAAWCLQGRASAGAVIREERRCDLAAQPQSVVARDRRSALTLTHGDIVERIGTLASGSFDAILHDPPRFGIAGELYSQAFYDSWRACCRRNGRLFHYTGTPNKLTSGRDVPSEVAKRLRQAGFDAELNGDGVLATKK